MKRFAVRILLFCIYGLALFFSPWITLIAGGLLFTFFFHSPIEILFLGLWYEIVSGAPPGIVILPLAGMLTIKDILASFITSETLFSRASIFLLGLVSFFFLRPLFIFIFLGFEKTFLLALLFTL